VIAAKSDTAAFAMRTLEMETRRLGRTGFAVSILGFGASKIGYQNVAADTVEKLLNGALDAGLNIIDTAACYDASEELIGTAISHRRADYFLFTKCGHASGLPVDDWTAALVELSLARSLKRLRTDYVDLLQFHSCAAATLRNDDLIAALVRAKEKGLTRAIGYSGDGADALYAVETGVFDALQISVNIADQEAIDLAIPAAAARDMGIIAKRPIANAAWLFNRWRVGDYEKPYWRRLKRLAYDFLRADAQTAVRTALRFTLAVAGVDTAIVGTTRPSRWAENAAFVADGGLPRAQFDAIRARWLITAKPDWTGQR
jgi:aryl-alcohol dehydrogenase-like predicted oxidoreductase